MITATVSERKGNDCRPHKSEITLDRKRHKLLPHCDPDDSWVWGVSHLVRGLPNTLWREYGLRAPAAGERLGGQALDTDLREKFYNQTPETRDQKRRWQLSAGPHQARKPWSLAMGCKTLMVPGLWQATNYQEAVRPVPRQSGLVECAPRRECVG